MCFVPTIAVFNWTEVSPDLTRDEEDKQGLGSGPYTNENIEVYNTIFAFEESPHDPETLWAGTDDGRVHLTRNGGAEWLDVTPRGVGRGLINSIDVSPHDPATAYVVVMKYKEGDNRPIRLQDARLRSPLDIDQRGYAHRTFCSGGSRGS